MSMPGLTAEASLYRTSKQYRALSLDLAGAASNAAVVPAYFPGPETQAVRSDCPNAVAEAYAISAGPPTLPYGDGSYASAFRWKPDSSPGVATGSITAASVPAHQHNDPHDCTVCLDLVCGAPYASCEAAALVACAPTGILYPICIAGAMTACETALLKCVGSICHARGVPSWLGGTLGPPCCPVVCSAGCCDSGEACAGLDPATGQNLCCSSGFTACSQNCCDASETCCGGQNCCAAGATCMPDGTCCPAGHAICGGICCPDPHDICDPTTNACKPVCPSGTQPCGETCCPTSQICCNGTCCAAGQECINGTCVTPIKPPCCPSGAPHCCGQCVPLAGGGSHCDDRCIDPRHEQCP
jgi:hypothetical protein